MIKTLLGGVLGLTSRTVRHGITPAALLFVLWDEAQPALQQELEAAVATGAAFVVSLLLSKISDAVKEAKERRNLTGGRP